MKKLLSLLLTLALATSAFAECAFYMDDFVVNRDQIGNNTEITLPIKATFSGRLNGWDLLISYPEHLIPTYIEPGADMTLTYYDARGKQKTLDAPLSGAYEPWDHLLCAIATEGYYQDPDGENPSAWVTHNTVKWEAGEYEEMLLLSFIVEEGFEGGEIVLKTCCASGRDPRGGTILENGDHKQWFERTVAVSLQAITEAPEITYTMDEDEAIITATGNGEVLLYVNGELVENPYTIARGEEDVEYTITATAQGEGEVVSEPAELKLVVPAKPEPVYGVGLKKLWSVNLADQMPEGVVTNDMRQGFGMNGKFYVNSKLNKVDEETGEVLAVPTVYVFDETGRIEKTYPGGQNCGITRDEAGNLVISDAAFPGAWVDATIKVINPETDVTKVYTVPAECGMEGRCDFIGFAQGDLMEDGVLYLVGQTTAGVSVMTITGGEVNTDECYPAPCDGLSPTTNTVVNYYKDLADEDAMLYVTRNAAPVKLKFDGSELVAETFTLPNKGACNGLFPFVWDGKELFLYPTLPNYLDGFAIAEANATEPLFVNAPNYTANPNGIQANWLNAETDKDGVTIYQYVPGGHVAVYRIAEFERTQTPEITYEITEDGVVITATGSGDVKLYVDGVLVENPYTIARGEEDVTVHVTATAQKEGKLISETAEQDILIPALPLPEKTEAPVINFETTDDAVIITATGEGEVLLYVYGDLVENPYTIARGEEDVTITVTATAQEEGKLISDPTEYTLVIPAYVPQTDMPVITFETTDDAVIITATGEGEVLLYVNGELVENPYTITRGEEDVTITVSATAQGEGKRISDVAEQTLFIPAYVPQTDMPVITFETTDDAVIITATGEGEVLLYVNGELVENPYTMARGEEDVTITVTATAQGEGKRISDVAEATLVIPAYQVTAEPVITIEITDDVVIITATGDGDVVLYVNGEPVENPYTITRGEEDVDIEVYATAKEDGKLMSTTAVQVVTIPKHSGIDEILGNKTVANVRYFNMAGQEMTEVNGATIIITTYTDGSHSTVKVIK